MMPEKFEHGGNLARVFGPDADLSGCLDFSANINPLGMPPEIRFELYGRMDDGTAYPDPDSLGLKRAAAGFYGISPENILPGNGASELFYIFLRSIKKPEALILCPSYSDYERAAVVEGKKLRFLELNEPDNFQPDLEKIEKILTGNEICILGRPNNPTGTNIPRSRLINLIEKNPETFFIIDEAFSDFVEYGSDDGSLASLIRPNLVTVKSLTKIFSIPGLRAGLATGPENLIREARRYQSSWPLNHLAQRAAEVSFGLTKFSEKTRHFLSNEREYIFNRLSRIPNLKLYNSTANFILLRVTPNDDADRLYQFMVGEKVVLRRCGNFRGLDNSYFRIAVLGRRENDRLAKLMEKFFKVFPDRSPEEKKKPPALMVVGTGSNVGKSLLAAALCRIFLNEGYRVLPFKAQNMSLNSCVTRDGHEISRAQHLQALASRVDPDVRMNPVLLKPSGNSVSQIVLMGKPVGNMGYRDYRSQKEKIWQTICGAYDELAADADLVIIEGAGSPVEMNLKENDVVNMKMAEYADARVLLAGNIDYGGIYAAFAGTLMLLDHEEKNRVIGLLVNQFRGDETLFSDGIKLLEKITAKKVTGVIPYVEGHRLPDEDSLAFGKKVSDNARSGKREDGELRIFVVRYPHISNFTDFDPFLNQEGVQIRFIEEPWGNAPDDAPDIIILPGSKNVALDMKWLEERGFAREILRDVRSGKSRIVGICGGFQMLGDEILDPLGIENHNLAKRGLGLIPVSTVMESDKVLRKFTGTHLESGTLVCGYEIHHGHTSLSKNSGPSSAETLSPLFNNTPDAGASVTGGSIWGSYIHGIFDSDELRQWFINRERERSGMAPILTINPYSIENAIEEFSRIVRDRIDLEYIRKSLGLETPAIRGD